MDEKKVREAIEVIKGYRRLDEYMNNTERLPYCDMAIEALEKQLSKKVDFEEDVAENMCVECPSCGSFLGYQVDCLDENYQFDYCEHCGQRIDWSE